MSHRHRAAIHIHARGVQAEQARVGDRDDAKGLVDLVEIHVVGGDAGMSERARDGERWRDRKVGGVALGVGPPAEARERGEAEEARFVAADEDDGGGAIADGGCVGGGDRAGMAGGGEGGGDRAKFGLVKRF